MAGRWRGDGERRWRAATRHDQRSRARDNTTPPREAHAFERPMVRKCTRCDTPCSSLTPRPPAPHPNEWVSSTTSTDPVASATSAASDNFPTAPWP